MDLIVRWSDRQKEFLSVSIVDTAILASLLNWAKFQPKWRRLLSAVNVICNQYTKNHNALIAICTIKELFCASKIGICIIFLSIDALDRVANNINFHLLLRINVNRFHSEWTQTISCTKDLNMKTFGIADRSMYVLEFVQNGDEVNEKRERWKVKSETSRIGWICSRVKVCLNAYLWTLSNEQCTCIIRLFLSTFYHLHQYLGFLQCQPSTC